jgi:hypothetical protein
MLCSTRELDGFALAAFDGDIGHVRGVYFDDVRWVIRHVVADTGGRLGGRDVLISPHSIRGLDRQGRRLDVALTRQQIEDAPDIDTAPPVSRQQQSAYYDHYGYPYWWEGSGLWGTTAYPLAEAILGEGEAASRLDEQADAGRAAADPHLRSSAEVIGYHIEAPDGAIGHIDDFLFDERSWAIRFVAVDTGSWLAGRQVLIAPQWVERIDWGERRAWIRLTREAVKSSPPYQRGVPLQEEHVRRVQRHFESSE